MAYLQNDTSRFEIGQQFIQRGEFIGRFDLPDMLVISLAALVVIAR